MPALDIAAVDVPATTAEAGCLVTYDAPAGCLSAVEISPSWIPGYRIEGYSFLDEGRTVTVEPLEADAVTTQGAKAEQRCQLESSGQYVNAVYPVSYTHLDVYKRQGLERGLLLDRQAVVGAAGALGVPVEEEGGLAV